MTEERRRKRNEYAREYRKRERTVSYNQSYYKKYYKTYKHTTRYILKTIKDRARNRGYEFNLTLDDLVIPDYCPVLKIKLDWDGPNDSKPTIDRVNNTKGYVKGNVRIISGRANRIKSDATPDELQKLADYANKQ